MGISLNVTFVLVLTLIFSFFSIALTIDGPTTQLDIGEGVIIDPEAVANSTYSNSSTYWGPYYYTLFANYPNWNTAFGWGDPSLTYVPYLGATGTVDLGSNNLETTGTLSAGQTSGDLAHFGYLRLDGNLEQFLGSMQTLRINATFINASENIMFDKDLIGGASFRVNSTTNTTSTRHIYPMEDNISDIGWVGESSALRFRNIYMDGVFSNALGDTVSLRELDDLEKNALTTRWLQGTPSYLYNDTTSLYFNETKLNETFQNWTEAQGFGAGGLWTNNSGVAQYIGGVVHGYMPNATDNYSIMVSEGEGAFAGGMAEGGYYELIPAFLSCGKYSTINASGNGSIAWGYAPERIESSCPYGFGQLQNGILSSGKGSLAGGTPVGDVNYINGSGDGSFTWGVGDQRNTHSGGTNIGRGNQVVGTGKTAGIGIGTSNLVNESYATAIGFSNQLRAGSTFSAAVGYLNTISVQYGYTFGSGNQIVNPAHQYITLLGTNMFSSGYNQVRLGVNNYGITINTTAIYMNQTLVLEPNGTGATCNSGLAGSIYYDGGTNKHRGCDGTSWNDLY